MRPVSVAVVRTGVISKESLAELRRWGLPVEMLMEEDVVHVKSPQQAVDIIRDALDAHDQTAIRESDLEIVRVWINQDNQQVGRLVLPVEGKKTSFKVVFCRTRMGEYVIPWNSESIADLVLTVDSQLHYEEDGVKKKVHFLDMRELFIGDHKAFMVCSGEEL